jgi:hypothetical protein
MKNIGIFAALFMILLHINGGFLKPQSWMHLDFSSGIPLAEIGSLVLSLE